MAHRRAKLTVEGRKLLVDRVRRQGWSVATAAEAQGCSRATAHKWLRRFDEQGPVGLVDRSSRPHRSPRRLSERREAAILGRRDAHLEGPHRIAWALGEAQSTVHKVITRNGRPRICDLDKATRCVVRYERDRPGELVHVDIKKLGRIPDGGGWRGVGWHRGRRHRGPYRARVGGGKHVHTLGYDYLHIAVDDRSRIAYAEVLPDEGRESAAAFIQRAFDWFAELGISVERIMTDNGSCYRSRTFNEVPRRSGCHAQVDEALSTADQRQGRALQPDPQERVGLRHRLHLESAAPRHVAAMAARLQPPPAAPGSRWRGTHGDCQQRVWEPQLGPLFRLRMESAHNGGGLNGTGCRTELIPPLVPKLRTDA